MARNINSVILSGNLVADPELRTLPSGTEVCDLRIAVNNGQSKDGQEYPVTFIDVVAWNGLGQNCAKFLAKGRHITVQGRLDYREWQSQDGGKRSKHQVTATSIEFGARPNGERQTAEQAADFTPPATDDIPF